MVSEEALKKLQEQIAAWPMTQRFVVQQLIEDYRRNREDLRAYKATGLTPDVGIAKKPIEAYVNGMGKFSHGLYVNVLFDTRKINGTRDYEINHIGKTVFFTHEQAVKALEAMKDDE